MPFVKYLPGIILAAYCDFESRMNLVDDKLSSIEQVRVVIKEKIGKSTFYESEKVIEKSIYFVKYKQGPLAKMQKFLLFILKENRSTVGRDVLSGPAYNPYIF